MARDTARTSQPIRSIAAALSLVVFAFAHIPAFGADGKPTAGHLHRAVSASERALNAILKVQASEQPGNMHLFDFLTSYKGARRAYDGVFGRYFSSAYLDAVAAFERDLVAQNCGGEYVEGDMCGLESSPLNCAQDVAPYGYWYRTEQSTASTAIIAAAWKRSGPWTARYRMKKEARGWVLDGVECPQGYLYNW